MNSFFPLNIDLDGKKIVVIGAGKVALRKIKKMMKYGADIHVISEDVREDEMVKFASDGMIRLEKKEISFSDLEESFLVVAATDDQNLNEEIYRYCKAKNILVNNANGEGDVIFPAVLEKGELTISVSSSGESPSLAVKIRNDINEFIEEKYSDVMDVFVEYRCKANDEIKDAGERKKFYSLLNEFMDGQMAGDFKENVERLFAGFVDKNKFTVIQKYDPEWPSMFEKIKTEIVGNIKTCSNIHHVGSTSIPGMYAKPVIDIDIEIEDFSKFAGISEELAKIGYRHEGNLGIDNREVFKRKEGFDNRVLDSIYHHLYVCTKDSEEFERHILFRDYLRTHEEYVKKYNDIKMEILSECGDNRKEYVRIKEENYKWFFEDVINKSIMEKNKN